MSTLTKAGPVSGPSNKKVECAYCKISVDGTDRLIYNEKVYHKACGLALRGRREYPGLFRMLDDIRNDIEELYDQGDLVVENQGQIMAIGSILTSIKKT